MAYDRLKFASLNKTRAGCAALSQINTTLSLDHRVVQLLTENLLAISLVKEKVIRFTLKEHEETAKIFKVKEMMTIFLVACCTQRILKVCDFWAVKIMTLCVSVDDQSTFIYLQI